MNFYEPQHSLRFQSQDYSGLYSPAKGQYDGEDYQKTAHLDMCPTESMIAGM